MFNQDSYFIIPSALLNKWVLGESQIYAFNHELTSKDSSNKKSFKPDVFL